MQKILSAAVFGIDAYLVEVEVDLNQARSDWYFATVGLPDAAVKESRERIRAAPRCATAASPSRRRTSR